MRLPIACPIRPYLAALLLAPAGCGVTQQALPSKVTAHEYEIYSIFLQHHLSRKPPSGKLYISARTFKFDPLESTCGKDLHDRLGVSWPMIKALHALGDAEYRLYVHPPAKDFHIGWPYEVADGYPDDAQGAYRLIAFSRVAFNSAHTRAVFAINDSCGGLCGGGGAVVAHRENGAWVFRNSGCIWVS